jgi:cysteine desulfuration protein SufE
MDKMTIDEIQNRIIDEMASREEWFDKYEYLVAQGKILAPLENRFKVDENLIPGCQSQVWIHGELVDGKVHFGADSDTLITRGMIALVIRVLNDREPRDIVDADLYFLQKTGLDTNLSPSRANGLAAIIRHMKRYATRKD